MEIVGQTDYLGSSENICLGAIEIRETATPASSISTAAPMRNWSIHCRGTTMTEAGALFPFPWGWGKWDVQPGEQTVLEAPKCSPTIPMRRLSRRHRQALHRVVKWEEKRQWAQAETREVQAGCKERLFHHEDNQAGKQTSQRGHAVSILGSFKD